ncbi:MAG: hypothetical protein RLZ98_1169 [Pseudomonadota bacterium]|jgi:GNAT superfamily N-acetyltransferase
MKRGTATRIAALTLLLALTCAAAEADPPVPSGADPGGIAVAIVSAGIDYRPAEVAAALARDGEGQMIGWDFVGHDEYPFAPNLTGAGDPGGLIAASRLAGTPIRLAAVRIDVADLKMRAAAIAFVSRTPARIAVLADWRHGPDGTALLEAAARRAPHLLLIVEKPAEKASSKPDPRQDAPPTTIYASQDAAGAVARAARHLAASPAASAADIKIALAAK